MIPSEPVTCVGIDLGTTFSCVAIYEDGDISVIPNRAGRSITPSVLFAPHNGSELIVGDGARTTAARMAGTLVYDAKRFIGKRYDADVIEREGRGLPFELVPGLSAERGQMEAHLQLELDGQRVTFAPEHVGTLIIHELKSVAEKYVGRKVQNVVLAVPVGFSALQINVRPAVCPAAGGGWGVGSGWRRVASDNARRPVACVSRPLPHDTSPLFAWRPIAWRAGHLPPSLSRPRFPALAFPPSRAPHTRPPRGLRRHGRRRFWRASTCCAASTSPRRRRWRTGCTRDPRCTR